jgi:hypothetical protein
MEVLMTYQDRDPLGNLGERSLTGERIRPTDTIRPADRGSRTLWNWVTFLAIIGVLFVVFYGINAEQERAKQTAAASLPTATETAPATSDRAPAAGTQPAQSDTTTGQAPPEAAPPSAGESKSDTGENNKPNN